MTRIITLQADVHVEAELSDRMTHAEAISGIKSCLENSLQSTFHGWVRSATITVSNVGAVSKLSDDAPQAESVHGDAEPAPDAPVCPSCGSADGYHWSSCVAKTDAICAALDAVLDESSPV